MKVIVHDKESDQKRVVVALLVLLVTASVQAQTQAAMPPQELKALEVFNGDWTYEGEAQESPLGPAGKFSGKMSVRWILNGFFQEWKTAEKGVFGDTEMYELDWYDAATKSYVYQQFQNNGNTVSGSGTVSGHVWNYSWVMNQKGVQYKFRNTLTFTADGRSFVFKGDISTDGKTWKPWAEIKNTQVASTPAAVEQELMQLEHDWAKAVVARHVQTLDRILAPDWSVTQTDGTVKSKAQELSDIASGNLTSSLVEASDMKVRAHAEMAVVTGRWTEKSTYHGKDTSGVYQFTDTFIRQDGRWQCVASHASKVVQK